MDLDIREFEQAIIKFINQSTVPVEAKRLVIKDIYNQLESASNVAISKAVQERNEKSKKKQEELEKEIDDNSEGTTE